MRQQKWTKVNKSQQKWTKSILRVCTAHLLDDLIHLLGVSNTAPAKFVGRASQDGVDDGGFMVDLEALQLVGAFGEALLVLLLVIDLPGLASLLGRLFRGNRSWLLWPQSLLVGILLGGGLRGLFFDFNTDLDRWVGDQLDFLDLQRAAVRCPFRLPSGNQRLQPAQRFPHPRNTGQTPLFKYL